MATKNQDAIIGSVRHGGTSYKAGDEEKFADAGLDKAELQRLADRGTIRGFGTKAKGEAPSTADDDATAKGSAGTPPKTPESKPAKGAKGGKK